MYVPFQILVFLSKIFYLVNYCFLIDGWRYGMVFMRLKTCFNIELVSAAQILLCFGGAFNIFITRIFF